MSDVSKVQYLAGEIRRISRAAPEPESVIESFLEGEFADLQAAERVALLSDVTACFADSAPGAGSATVSDSDVARMVALFLGKDVNSTEMNPREVAERFAAALKTLFDSLNEVVAVMNSTLTGSDTELDTIRMIISSSMEQESDTCTMQEYLDRIRHSFLLAHSSFQQAAKKVCTEMLAELDPEKLLEKNSGLKFGPLRKADQFDAFEVKFNRLSRWLETGGFSEKLLREFEKSCRQAMNA